ncbi:VPS9 domain-containing protein 1 isoform X2 [Vidua macroura]|uniref:VPS9 domain-containing protein 1 isoform X2 n=1 Tax=Vidua macroura TaxID=187451 RepID=UPI0023A8DBA2|nr:VPS9 domain-containing protein 1 isoform X2 [Vidua macroura]
MAAPGGGEGPAPGRGGRGLQGAMRAASGALGMDSAGRTREAYVEYLRSITLIAQALQEEAAGTENSEGVTPDTPKLLKLAEQCLERVKSIAAALGKAQVKAAAPERGGGPAPLPRHRRVCSDEGGKLSPFLPPEIFQKLQIAEAQSARKELTPLEEASLQNQKLKAAYEARVARLNPSQAVQKTSLTLSLQRQMMENLVIAKAREETLQRKMEERRLRLQEAANRRFSSSVALTPEEQEQRALYAAILEYEQDHDWPKQWKAQLKRSPADLSVVSGLFSCLLSGALGPAEPPEPPRESSFEDLERFLASPEGWGPAEPPASSGQDTALPELLKGVVRDIHNAIDRLLALTLLAFEGLGSAAGKDQCLACLEEAFFPPLWAPLLALYRTVQQPREAALARSMERHRRASPADMGLASRLFPPGQPAYASAVQDLRLIPLETCPRRKLECIVRALRGICECAEEYCGTRDARSLATAAIGADDLLPILSYVVLQTGLPQLLSECAALEEFIHEGMCAGSALRQEQRQDYGQEFRQEFHQEYRRSLERELGPAGTCPGPAVAERLRQRLQQEPALLEALQEDALALLARGLRDHPDPQLALRGLASAFRLLELAAVNLYLFPWRREFGTIPTFSGAYVHLLRPALPEADLVRSLGRLGYERRDQHRLAVGQLPPGPALIGAAVGFLACRLECEILAELAPRLRRPRADELLEARHRAGGTEGCPEMLQELGTQRGAAADCGDDVDLYRESPDSPEDTGSKDTAPPALWRDPQDVPARGWGRCDSTLGPEPAGSADPDTSHLLPEREMAGPGRSPQVLAEPRDSLQATPELPCYQLHSCLHRGMLPSYCCSTCRQLHGGSCAVGRACRGRHRGQELRGERQQRLWLQRTELDMLLAKGSAPRS